MNMRTIATLSITLLSACAPDLGAGADGELDPQMPFYPMDGQNVSHVDQGDGIFLTTVDATSDEDWIYLDLDDGLQVDVADPQDDLGWHLAFQRFHVKLNGGVSGRGGVEAAALNDALLEDLEIAPGTGYVTDQPDGDDDNEDPDYALREWYAYDFMTHVLTPHPRVYVVRTADSMHYALQVESYYDQAGSSGYVGFRWSPIEGP